MSDFDSEREAAGEGALEGAVVTVRPKPKRRKKKQTDQQSQHKRQPPYAVIIENDDCHTPDYVIDVLRRICLHDQPKAVLLTSQIHFTGRAVVWTGTMELAELKRDQIRGFGPDHYTNPPVKFPLGVVIEPMPGD